MLFTNFRKQVESRGRWILGFFRTEVLDLRCTSLLADQALTLPGLILRGADEAQVAFIIQSSVASFRAGRKFSFRLSGARSEVGAPEADAAGWEVKHSRSWRRTHVLVRISRQVLTRQHRLELTISDRGRRLSTLRFRLIDEAEAQRLRIEELKALDQRLWVHSGDRSYLCDVVAETSAALAPEFTLTGSQLHATLPACQARLSLSLVAERRTPFRRDGANHPGTQTEFGAPAPGQPRGIFLRETPILLGNGPVRVKATPIALEDCPALQQPGGYRLVAAVGGKELAGFPFRIASRKEWRDQVQVTALLEAETVKGETRRQTGALRWDRHVAFYPFLKIQAPIPAPNTPVKCLARIQVDQTILYCCDFLIRLTEHSAQVRLPKFDLHGLDPRLRAKRICLLLTIHLDDNQKASRPVLILPADAMTNFEGQLRQDADALALDEAAYDHILRSLAPKHAPG